MKFWVITQNEEATYCLLRPTMATVKKEVVEYARRKTAVYNKHSLKSEASFNCPNRTLQLLAPTDTDSSPPDTISTTSKWTVNLRYNMSPYDAARKNRSTLRTWSLTALGDTTERRTRPDRRVTTRDVTSLLHSHTTSLLWKKRRRNPIIVTTSLCTLPILNIHCFILYSPHGTEDTAEVKNVPDETQRRSVISHRGRWHIRKLRSARNETSTLRRICWAKVFYKTKSESLPLGELRRRSDDYEWTQTVYGCKLSELTDWDLYIFCCCC